VALPAGMLPPIRGGNRPRPADLRLQGPGGQRTQVFPAV